MSEVRIGGSKRAALAFLAGAMFLLAGALAALAHLGGRGAGSSSVSALFGVTGMLWILVGMKFQKADAHKADANKLDDEETRSK